jgi:glutamine synthetase type III
MYALGIPSKNTRHNKVAPKSIWKLAPIFEETI